MNVRATLLKLHLWGGLATALPLIVVGVTGAMLVYGDELDREIDPQLHFVTPGATRLPAQALLDTVRAAYPGERFVGCSLPPAPERSFMCYSASRNYMYLDPYTGRVLGSKALHTGLRRKMFLLHSQLMAGTVGHTIVAVSTVASLFLVVSGVWLWWKFKVFGVKRRAGWWRVNFDLHSVLGLYSAAVFFVLSATGVIIAYEGFFYPRILRASGASPDAMRVQSVVREGAGAGPTLDAVIATGERALPGVRATVVGLPHRPTDTFTVYARFPEEPTSTGKCRVRIDRYTGAVLATKSTRVTNWGERMVDLMEATHFGEVFGHPGRIVALLVSLLVAGQVITGALIWWKKV